MNAYVVIWNREMTYRRRFPKDLFVAQSDGWPYNDDRCSRSAYSSQ